MGRKQGGYNQNEQGRPGVPRSGKTGGGHSECGGDRGAANGIEWLESVVPGGARFEVSPEVPRRPERQHVHGFRGAVVTTGEGITAKYPGHHVVETARRGIPTIAGGEQRGEGVSAGPVAEGLPDSVACPGAAGEPSCDRHLGAESGRNTGAVYLGAGQLERGLGHPAHGPGGGIAWTGRDAPGQ